MKEEINNRTNDTNSNNEFIYRITHDLKAPLRGIQNLTQWIQDDIKSGNKESLNENIALINQLVTRTNKMMDDIKLYSKLGSIDDKIQIFESPKYFENLAIRINARKNNLIEIDADTFQFSAQNKKFQVCIESIIENAIEFNTNSNPKLSLFIEEKEQSIHICVKDNGPGIPDHMKNQIFGLFTTTKSKEDTKHTGVGFALAKRSVEAVNGSLEIKTSDQGTTVTIIWPK